MFRKVAPAPTPAPREGLRLILAPTLWLTGALAAAARHLAEMPGAALRISPPDAGRLGIEDGAEVEIEFESGGETVRLPARVDESLPAGVAQAPEGCPAAPLNSRDAGSRGALIRVSPVQQTVGA